VVLYNKEVNVIPAIHQSYTKLRGNKETFFGVFYYWILLITEASDSEPIQKKEETTMKLLEQTNEERREMRPGTQDLIQYFCKKNTLGTNLLYSVVKETRSSIKDITQEFEMLMLEKKDKLEKLDTPVRRNTYKHKAFSHFLINKLRYERQAKRTWTDDINHLFVEEHYEDTHQRKINIMSIRKLLAKTIPTLDDDEIALVFYKMGLCSGDEVREHFGNISQQAVSKRWLKLRKRLAGEFAELEGE